MPTEFTTKNFCNVEDDEQGEGYNVTVWTVTGNPTIVHQTYDRHLAVQLAAAIGAAALSWLRAAEDDSADNTDSVKSTESASPAAIVRRSMSSFTPDELRRYADIMESNDDQPGFDFWSAVAAADSLDDEAEAIGGPDSVKSLGHFPEFTFWGRPDGSLLCRRSDGASCLVRLNDNVWESANATGEPNWTASPVAEASLSREGAAYAHFYYFPVGTTESTTKVQRAPRDVPDTEWRAISESLPHSAWIEPANDDEWAVTIPPRGAQDYEGGDPKNGAIIPPYGDSFWTNLDEAIEFVHKATKSYTIDQVIDEATAMGLLDDNPVVYAYPGDGDPLTPATAWYFQGDPTRGDECWMAVVAEWEPEGDWFEDGPLGPTMDWPEPRTYSIDQRPPYGHLIYRTADGSEISEPASTDPKDAALAEWRRRAEHAESAVDGVEARNEDALRKLLADWFDAELFRISERGHSGEWPALIEDAKARHETFGIPWSNTFVPAYVREVMALSADD